MSFAAHLPLPGRGSPSVADDTLIRRAASEPVAFDVLFARHRDGLRGFLLRRLRDYEEADDAVSATFCKAWRARESYRGAASGKAWLYQIATRVALDFLRSRRRRPEEELDPLDPDAIESASISPDPADELLQRHHSEALRRGVLEAVAALSQEDGRLVRMYYFEEASYEAISARLGITRSQVRGRLHRIRARLRRQVESSGLD